MTDDELMQPREVERLFGITGSTLWRWRRDGVGPLAVDIGADNAKRPTYRYWRSQIETWLKEKQS